MSSPALAAAPAGCAPSIPSPASTAAATPDCAAPIATSSDAPPVPSSNDAVLRTALSHTSNAPPQPSPRRKPHRPNVPPILLQQVKHAQLMPRFPAIHQLNLSRYGPITVSDQMRRMLRPQLPGPVNHFGPRTKAPKAIPTAAARITFNSVRPRRVRIHRPSSSSVPYGGNSGAGVAQAGARPG